MTHRFEIGQVVQLANCGRENPPRFIVLERTTHEYAGGKQLVYSLRSLDRFPWMGEANSAYQRFDFELEAAEETKP